MPKQKTKQPKKTASTRSSEDNNGAAINEVAGLLLRRMQDSADDSAAQNDCIAQLELYHDEGALAAADMTTATRSAVKAMKTHLEDARLMSSACGFLSKLCSPDASKGDLRLKEHHKQNRRSAAEEGVCGAVIAVMVKHAENPEVQLAASRLLSGVRDWFLSLSETNQRAAVHAVVAAMRTLNAEESTNNASTLPGLITTLQAFERVIKGDCSLTKEAFSTIVITMTRHATDTKIQIAGCASLNELIISNDHLVEIVWREGLGLVISDAFLTSMDLILRHEAFIVPREFEPESFFTGCCQVLYQLYKFATFDAHPQALSSKVGEAVGIVLRLLDTHKESPILLYHAMQMLTCLGLQKLEKQEEQQLIRPAMEAVLCLMELKKNSREVQIGGLNALRGLISQRQDQSLFLVQGNGLSRVLRLLKNHDDARWLGAGFAACQLFSKMAEYNSVEVKTGMLIQGCIQAAIMSCGVDTMSNNNQDIPFAVCLAISRFVSEPHNRFIRAAVMETGGIPAAMRGMSADKTSPEVQYFGCHALVTTLMGQSCEDPEGVNFGRTPSVTDQQLIQMFPLVSHALQVVSTQQPERVSLHDIQLLEISGLGLLYAIALQFPHCKTQFGPCGAIALVARLLQRMVRGERSDVWSDEHYVKTCLQTLYMACEDEGSLDNKKTCIKEKAVDVLFDLVDKYKDDNFIQRTTLLTLNKIAEGHEELTARLAKKKLIQRVFKASQKPTSIEAVKEGLSTMLEKLAVQAPNGQDMVKAMEERQKEKLLAACTVCGKTAQELGLQQLKFCSVCTIRPPYCSSACQGVHWPEHKKECKANRKSS
jgi:hypothetical protein